MDRFVSNTTLRLDAKGRVSIPASFRSLLTRDGFAGLYCYPALDQPAIEAGGTALLAEIDALVNSLPPYSGEREDFLIALYGRSKTMTMDTEGRVVLPQELKAHARITDAVAFVGLGHKFQIWEPQRLRAHLVKATATVRTLSKRLGPERPAADDGARE
jgi:MraZ protein